MNKMTEEETVLEYEKEELEVGGRDEEQIYPMEGLKIEKGFYTVYELKRRYDAVNQRVILDSEFQRNDVWNMEKKAELVESVLMGLPLPIFYFNQDRYGRLIVVDGRQRLTALFRFMDDKYALKNIKIMGQVKGMKFSELPPVFQNRIEDFQIQAHVILPPTPDRIKFDIFDRVNRGGMQLNKQEIRNALYQGNATSMLKRVTESRAFADATGDAFVNEKRMKDKYLITRFVAFYLYREGKFRKVNGKPYIYKDDIDDLLGRGLDAVNLMSVIEVDELIQLVIDTLRKSAFYLGSDAFRLRREGRRSPVNMNVFETIMFVMLQLSSERAEIRAEVNEMILRLISSEAFRTNIGNHRDTDTKIEWRISEAIRLGKALEML